jgi:hypothetical protein
VQQHRPGAGVDDQLAVRLHLQRVHRVGAGGQGERAVRLDHDGVCGAWRECQRLPVVHRVVRARRAEDHRRLDAQRRDEHCAPVDEAGDGGRGVDVDRCAGSDGAVDERVRGDLDGGDARHVHRGVGVRGDLRRCRAGVGGRAAGVGPNDVRLGAEPQLAIGGEQHVGEPRARGELDAEVHLLRHDGQGGGLGSVRRVAAGASGATRERHQQRPHDRARTSIRHRPLPSFAPHRRGQTRACRCSGCGRAEATTAAFMAAYE